MIDWKAMKMAADSDWGAISTEPSDENFLRGLYQSIPQGVAIPPVKRSANLDDFERMDPYMPKNYSPITEKDAERLASYFGLRGLGGKWRALDDESMFFKPTRLTRDANGELYIGGNHVNDMDGYYTYDNGNPVFSNKGEFLSLSGRTLEDDYDTLKRIDDYPDYDVFMDAHSKAWGDIDEGDNLDYWKGLDRNGYLLKAGVVNPGDSEENQVRAYQKAFWKLQKYKKYEDYIRYLKANYPDEFSNLRSEWGDATDFSTFLDESTAPMQDQRTQRQQQRAAQRWGNNQINLTPEQYAYYDAKRQLQANPGSNPHWTAYMKARRPMKPSDLGQVRKYTVQQRMMNTPQPNGLPKTPAMLQQEWQQENRRRMQEQKGMYNGEIQGMKNRTGVQPTPTNPWNY